MGKRKLPFGYRLENGDVITDIRESSCVNWIFLTYNIGASLKEIASELNARGNVLYDTGKPWNKNMLGRILQDQRYSGDALYPEIISEKLFGTVQQQRASRRGLPKQTEAQKMIRILGGGKVNEQMECDILGAMNHLIQNPNAIRCPVPAEPDQTVRFRAQRELDAVMTQQPIDEDRASDLIKAIAEAEYDMIDGNEYETERLQIIFPSAEQMYELSADLLQKTVAAISVEIKTVRLTLKNNQTIEVSDAS